MTCEKARRIHDAGCPSCATNGPPGRAAYRYPAQNAALLALFILCASARAAADEAFIIPPAPKHYVTDNTGAMSPNARAKVENTLRAYERQTGHQVIVYIDQTTGGIPLETYTTETAHHWGIGRRGYAMGRCFFSSCTTTESVSRSDTGSRGG